MCKIDQCASELIQITYNPYMSSYEQVFQASSVCEWPADYLDSKKVLQTSYKHNTSLLFIKAAMSLFSKMYTEA